MQQTAIDYHHDQSSALIHQYLNNEISTRELLTMHHNLFYPSKEMEKQQIIDAWENGEKSEYLYLKNQRIGSSEEYYNETYGSKGSDNSQNTKQ